METKHTPGPWHVPKDIPGPRVFGPDKWMVADCRVIIRRSTDEEKANAQLIAAPDMPAALKQIMEEGITGPSCDAACAAIAKAEGWK